MNLFLDIDRIGIRSVESGAPDEVLDVARYDGSLDPCLNALLSRHDRPAPQRVIATCPPGSSIARHLGDAVLRHWGVGVEWADQFDEMLAFRAAHRLPRHVSAARCLGLMAAGRGQKGPSIFAHAGEAMTVDVTDSISGHRADVYLPGERLLREALYAQTSGVAEAALVDEPAVDGVFGVNTAGAVRQGARLFLAAVLDRSAADLVDPSGTDTRVALAGPLASELAPLLAGPFELYPDLVLKTLARMVGKDG